MANIPKCKMCGDRHYFFTDCDDFVAIERDKHKVYGPKAQLEVIEDPSRRGLRPWGDRLKTVQNQGGTLTLLETKRNLHRGSVIPSDDWGNDAA